MNVLIDELKKYGKRIRVLYVEDNEEARKYTLEMLERFFNNVTTAVDGEDALEKFKASTYNLVLTDINMPNMNGIELIRHLKDINKDISVLVLSAHDEVDYFVETIKLGIDGYLLKPLEPKQFITTLYKSLTKIILQEESLVYKQRLESMNEELEEKVKTRTAELAHRLHHDQLTELKNHLSLMSELSASKSQILILMDIDGFEQYNELYGMSAGNKILRTFTKYLQEFNHSRDYGLYRVYGDGFVLYKSIQKKEDQKDIEALLKVFENLSAHIDEIDETINFDVTIGISMESDNIFETANMVLGIAKKQKISHLLYTKEMDISQQLINDLYWKGEIKKALETDNIIPVFQGIVDKEQKIVKYEALMRLVQYDEEGNRKLIVPFFFLKASKKTKQYNKLTREMISKTFLIMSKKNVDFSINLSFEDIADPVLVDFLESEILRYKVGNRLILEILESEMVSNYDLLIEVVHRLKKHKIRIAIDDFGSGFSNFEHIFKLNPDYLKIDASLIKTIDTDIRLHTLVKAITGFSKELGIKVIAEYVSSKEIFEVLRPMEIDEYQGFYFSVPSEII
ncbi:MAG: REC domain-containing phosphodiesterase [Arcobacter sp.]|nr:MAG: REC domain-containing phosphodiesterase [Arcobacter sp.]